MKKEGRSKMEDRRRKKEEDIRKKKEARRERKEQQEQGSSLYTQNLPIARHWRKMLVKGFRHQNTFF